MPDLPYNPNPSEELIAAFQQVNIAANAVYLFTRLATSMCDNDNKADIEALQPHLDALIDAASTCRVLWGTALEALHKGNLLVVKTSAHNIQAMKQIVDKSLRAMLETYTLYARNSQEGLHPLRNETGEFLSASFTYGPLTTDLSLPFEGENPFYDEPPPYKPRTTLRLVDKD